MVITHHVWIHPQNYLMD